jgi:transposase
MLKVEHYARIRLAHRDGMSIRQIARTFGHSRQKIRQVLDESAPKPYTLARPRPCRKLTESFQKIIDEILVSDQSAPKKQRHTAKRIFDRLRDEHGFSGGYDAVRRYVKKQRTGTRETFLPISIEAGQRAEADFGQIEVDFPEGRRTVSVLMITWAYSGAVFAIALPSEKVEAILHGTMEAFEFFGCVPKELWWDNPKTVAKTILRGRNRELNSYYQSLASHYNFDPLFCLPARGNEKPHVEGRVKWLKRNWATPVPEVNDLDEFNAYLRQCCVQDFERTISGKTGTIGERFAAEKQQALALPLVSFDPCISDSRDVDKYQTVAWEGVRYSVPRRDAFSKVVVKARVDSIEVFRDGRLIARHKRSYAKGEMILDPLHYLATLDRKPAYLDHTDVYKNWHLPREFADLRGQLEQRHGAIAGARQFIQVLQLLASHSQARVIEAIKSCDREGVTTAQRVIFRCGALAERDAQHACVSDELTKHDADPSSTKHSPGPHVPRPDLSQFDALLSRGGRRNEEVSQSTTAANTDASMSASHSRVLLSSETNTKAFETQGGVTDAEKEKQSRAAAPTAEVEPEATSLADDVGRISKASRRGSRCEPGLLGVPVASDGTGIAITQCQCFGFTHSQGGVSGAEGTRLV